jgi:hypothetical protein
MDRELQRPVSGQSALPGEAQRHAAGHCSHRVGLAPGAQQRAHVVLVLQARQQYRGRAGQAHEVARPHDVAVVGPPGPLAGQPGELYQDVAVRLVADVVQVEQIACRPRVHRDPGGLDPRDLGGMPLEMPVHILLRQPAASRQRSSSVPSHRRRALINEHVNSSCPSGSQGVDLSSSVRIIKSD